MLFFITFRTWIAKLWLFLMRRRRAHSGLKQTQTNYLSWIRCVCKHCSGFQWVQLPGCSCWAHGDSGVAACCVCVKNQRPPLLEWEADVSEEFSWLQQFLSFEALPPCAPSPFLSLRISTLYFFFVSLTPTLPGAFLKSEWWQFPSLGPFFLLPAEEVFFGLSWT